MGARIGLGMGLMRGESVISPMQHLLQEKLNLGKTATGRQKNWYDIELKLLCWHSNIFIFKLFTQKSNI